MTPVFSMDHDDRSTHGRLKNSVKPNQKILAHYALDPDCIPMTQIDQEKLNDLLSANNITWGQQLEGKEKRRHEEQQPNQEAMVNMAEGAIRRLVKVRKLSLEKFCNELTVDETIFLSESFRCSRNSTSSKNFPKKIKWKSSEVGKFCIKCQIFVATSTAKKKIEKVLKFLFQ